MKEGLLFTLIKISKKEMFYLHNKGVPFGENGITHTTARHRKTYYLTESKRNKSLLEKYRYNYDK